MLNNKMYNDGVYAKLEGMPKAPKFRVVLLDRNQKIVCDLDDSLIDPTETEDLQGGFSVEFFYPANATNYTRIEEDFYIALPDVDMDWQLYQLKKPRKSVRDGNDGVTIEAEHAYHELATYISQSRVFRGSTLEATLAEILAPTRWKLGLVADLGNRSFSYIDKNPLQELRAVQSAYECEFRFRVVLSGTEVSALIVDVVASRGTDTGIRFEFGFNLQGIEIEINTEDIVTALQGRGEGGKIDESSDETERLNFKNIEWSTAKGDQVDKPFGQDWVGDETARGTWGLPDGQGGKRHVFGVYESQAKSPEELLKATWVQIKRRRDPRIFIQADVIDLESINHNFNHLKARLGDTVQIVTPKLNAFLDARIIKIERRRKEPGQTKLEIGNYRPMYTDDMLGIANSLRVTQARKSVWDKKETSEGSQEKANDAVAKAIDHADLAVNGAMAHADVVANSAELRAKNYTTNSASTVKNYASILAWMGV